MYLKGFTNEDCADSCLAPADFDQRPAGTLKDAQALLRLAPAVVFEAAPAVEG